MKRDLTNPNLNQQCKICNLLKQDRDLFIQLHQLVNQEGLSRAKAMKWLGEQAKLRNLARPKNDQIPEKWSEVNASNHFTRHLPRIEAAKQKAIASILPQRRDKGDGYFDAEEMILAQSVLNHKGIGDVEDYVNMYSFVETIESHLKLTQDQLKKGELKTWTLNDLATFQKLVSNLIDSKNKMVEMRNKDRIAGDAVKAAIEMVLRGVIDQVYDVTSEIHVLLTRELPDTKVPEEVINLIRNRLGENLRNMVDEVLSQIRKEYQIK